jgi:hypothetical protein
MSCAASAREQERGDRAAWPWLPGWALIGGGALFVSFSAQYAYIFTVRRQDAATVIEALLLDLLMIVFTLLALGLSRAGQSARGERILILACAAASAYMNVSAADVASPRSVTAYALAPIAGCRGGPGRGGDPPPRPGRPRALGLEHRWLHRGGCGQDRRAGAAVLSAVRPGCAGDSPGTAEDGAGCRSAARAPRDARAWGDRAAPAPRRPSCSPCTAPIRTTGTATEPAGSPPNWPHRRGCSRELRGQVRAINDRLDRAGLRADLNLAARCEDLAQTVADALDAAAPLGPAAPYWIGVDRDTYATRLARPAQVCRRRAPRAIRQLRASGLLAPPYPRRLGTVDPGRRVAPHLRRHTT